MDGNDIINSIMPIVGMALAALFAWLIPKLAKLLNDNSDNIGVQIARSVIAELVQALENSGLDDANKKATAVQEAVRALKPRQKQIERATGQDLNAFVDSTIEAAVFRKDAVKAAHDAVGEA